MATPRPFPAPDKALSVLNAATSVFLTHGFSGASTDMIQREAGVSKATIYACYPSKEDMFAAVIERQCATMAAAIRKIQTSPGDIAGTLADIGRAYLEIVLSDVGVALFRVVAAESPRFPDLGRRFYLAGPKTVASILAGHLSDAAQAGEVDLHPVGVQAAASLFIGMVRAEGQLECLMHPASRPSAEQLERWVWLAVDTFLGRFRTHTTPH
ncbi:TetR/AcrR family transcriptional regulator [Stutzerimonas nitrititolerans]|uniref:TetR/AcrR family transcriptional regulator n=1 Tax=Stutzerimonas nitrititolerans TaxID=2482751 RepID=UPI0028A0C9AD|nr:TetR/AcrR family transcriptional regulator [Stutzerimonas nitrititolerans]